MKLLNITYPDINNGPGCRVTIWLPGCTHRCPGCHNAWTAEYDQGYPFDDKARSELFDILDKDYISGLTVSGGDPLDQSDEILGDLAGLLSEVKERYPDKTIWLYTGYTLDTLHDMQLDVLEHCDVLVDGPYIEALRDPSLAFRGSSNQHIIHLQ